MKKLLEKNKKISQPIKFIKNQYFNLKSIFKKFNIFKKTYFFDFSHYPNTPEFKLTINSLTDHDKIILFILVFQFLLRFLCSDHSSIFTVYEHSNPLTEVDYYIVSIFERDHEAWAKKLL